MLESPLQYVQAALQELLLLGPYDLADIRCYRYIYKKRCLWDSWQPQKEKSQCRLPRVLEQGHAICSEELDNFQNATVSMLLGSDGSRAFHYGSPSEHTTRNVHHILGLTIIQKVGLAQQQSVKKMVCTKTQYVDLPQGDEKPLGGKLTTLDLTYS